jgi:uncharacterized protein YaiL (DUF2058 family)
MQNLRDQLLKTGVVTKDQKRQVEQQKRRERKQHKPGQLEETTQAEQRQTYEARLEAQRAVDRERAAAQRTLLEAREKRLQIRHIIDYWKVAAEPAGNRRWYFPTRHNVIKYLYVAEPVAARLSSGDLAIVEYPEEVDMPFTLIDHEAAELITRVDPMYVRFFNSEPASEV